VHPLFDGVLQAEPRGVVVFARELNAHPNERATDEELEREQTEREQERDGLLPQFDDRQDEDPGADRSRNRHRDLVNRIALPPVGCELLGLLLVDAEVLHELRHE